MEEDRSQKLETCELKMDFMISYSLCAVESVEQQFNGEK